MRSVSRLMPILLISALRATLASASQHATCPVLHKLTSSARSMIQKQTELAHVLVSKAEPVTAHEDSPEKRTKMTASPNDVQVRSQSHADKVFSHMLTTTTLVGPIFLMLFFLLVIVAFASFRSPDGMFLVGLMFAASVLFLFFAYCAYKFEGPIESHAAAFISTILGPAIQTRSIFASPMSTWVIVGPLIVVTVCLTAVSVFISVFGHEEDPQVQGATGPNLSSTSPPKTDAVSTLNPVSSVTQRSRDQKDQASSAAQIPSTSQQAKNHSAHGESPTRSLGRKNQSKDAMGTLSAFTSDVADWFTEKDILCPQLVEASERILTVHSFSQASSEGVTNHEVHDARARREVLHVRMRPGTDDSASLAGGPALAEPEVLELLTEERANLLAFCCLPSHDFAACADVCKSHGRKFAKIHAEQEFNRFSVSFPEGNWIITGDFSTHTLRISGHDGQPIARTEPGIQRHWMEGEGVSLSAKKIKVCIAPDVDAGLVLCSLLVVDRVYSKSAK
eukprot:gnl/MRDRNA2_/MRDRNA2_39919_c0_seq1.p1 gnl/MRDRNA2_/MRDRNA2_39919_c0~~gnl/MRDRNA2_/MRDRNA2_39919_c0_seq1.p1  ORF type:complete len:507 (+),score=90.18 gnl/MRDRNA2_/MRDRNA2_39919_c0_seq1:165-1685(+)